jgi:hypothetical protein
LRNVLNCKKNPFIFHRYLIEYLGEKKQAVGADLDSSEEFWSYPIYAYEMKVSSAHDKDTIVCKIRYADDFVDFDYVGTAERETSYTYSLDKDAEGSYIGTGEWLSGNGSDNIHPEWVWVPVGINQSALFLDYEKIAEMAHSMGGDLKGGGLLPGHHIVLVGPEKKTEFVVRAKAGEKICCRLALDRQAPFGELVEGQLWQEGVLIRKEVLTRNLKEFIFAGSEAEPLYRLVLRPDSGNQRVMPVHLVVDAESAYTNWFYGFPNRSTIWVGCGVAIPRGLGDGRAWVETVDNQGFPVGCGSVSEGELEDGDSWLAVVKNESPVDYNFNSGHPAGVKLVTNFPQQGLFLSGGGLTLRGNPETWPVPKRDSPQTITSRPAASPVRRVWG